MTLPSGLVAPLALTGLSTDPAAPDPRARDAAGDRPPLRGRAHAAARGLLHRPGVRAAGRRAPSTPSGCRAGRHARRPAGERRRCRAPAARPAGGCCSAPPSSLGAARAGGAALLWGRRRRRRLSTAEPDGEDVPLRFEGVTKAYKDGFVAVRDLSFEVRRGQVLGLLGPNGAGKTTSLRMLMGLIRPTAGRIRVFGHEATPGAPVLSRLGSLRRGHRAAAAPVRPGQPDPVLGGHRPAARRRAHGRGARDRRASATAIDKRVRSYSQGMRQRVAIAQAMLGLPDLLVLDEPTNGLDPPQIHAMREVLRAYAATGRTVIVSSHLLSEIEQTCSHVVVMAKGREDRAGHGRGDRRHRRRGAGRASPTRPTPTAPPPCCEGLARGVSRGPDRRRPGRRPRRHGRAAALERAGRGRHRRRAVHRRAGTSRTRSWRWWGSHEHDAGRAPGGRRPRGPSAATSSRPPARWPATGRSGRCGCGSSCAGSSSGAAPSASTR